MSPGVSWAIAKHEFRSMRQDLETPIFLFAMPLLMMAIMKPLFRIALVSEGYPDATGAEQAVPGMAMLFASLYVGYVAFAFFRDHGWGTWERLRASPARPAEILAGKLLPSFTISVAQLVLLFAAGVLLFDLQAPRSLSALALVSSGLVLALISFGVMITALCRTSQQLSALEGLFSMLFGVLGGGLVPITMVPQWAQTVAPVTPTYWAMKGFRAILLSGAGVPGVVVPVFVLIAFAGAFSVIAAAKFRFEETKIYFG